MADPDDALHELAETVEVPCSPSGGASAEVAGVPAPIPATWDRYEIEGLLGEGGMGRVYRAHDPVLKREVALKVLHAGSSALVSGFLREARAQARVSHPNVGKVFDVGIVGDRPFIAMQLIGGRPLGDVAPSLPHAKVAALIRSVAEGVDAANRLGLVHRDLKPGNVLVEERADGTLHPWVVDFGLARDLSAEGQTVSGSAVGTPSFMAPEQATGETGAIGPRTDVYGLGATLYASLAGRPPFRGVSAVDVMLQVVDREPEPLGRIAPDVPRDLVTIVGRCMEKDPARRYAAAAEVAADLDRFLAGEPIAARAPTLAYRLRLRARKHRVVVSVAAAALVVLVVLGGFHLREAYRLRRQAELARDFSRVVERLEAQLRQSYLLPPHDVRPARRRVEEQIRTLRARTAELGDLARAPGAYATGRALLALGRPEPAIAKLKEAWDSGYRAGEAAFALALAHARMYEEELAALAAVRSPVLREARRRDAQARYRDPAVAWLKLARGDDAVYTAYAEALIAFLEKRRDEAVRRAREAFEGSEGFYEAKLLEAEVEADRAREEIHGGAFDAARATLVRAVDAARAATRIGESDPATYETLCGIESTGMLADLYSSISDLEPGRFRAEAACEEALRVDPDSAGALRRLGSVYRLAAEARLRKGQDPGRLLDSGLAVARRAVAAEPDDVAGLSLLGSIWQVKGRREANSGGDPRASFGEAVAALRRAVDRRPRLEAGWNSLGVTWWYLAQWELGHGLDPRASLDAAARSLKRSAGLLPEYAFAWVNLGGVLNDRGAWELSRGLDPGATLAEATESFEKALALAGGMADAWNNSGATRLYAVQHACAVGRDPRVDAARAIAAFDKASELSPGLFAARFNRAQTQRYEASWRVEHGLDPGPGLSEARTALQALVGQETFRDEALVELSAVHVVAARREASASRSPLRDLEEARRRLGTALASDPKLGHGHRLLAEAALVEARWLAAQGRPAAPALEAARRAVDAAAAIDPGHAELARLRKDLEAITAKAAEPTT